MMTTAFIATVFVIAIIASLSLLFVIGCTWAGVCLIKDIIKELRNDK